MSPRRGNNNNNKNDDDDDDDNPVISITASNSWNTKYSSTFSFINQ
jgi:hypothetical protein